jgi:hypothetical protein
MKNYIVIEVQTDGGVTSTLSYQYDNLAEARQKYYLILSVAVVSTIDNHAALIVDEDGYLIMNESFHHDKPEPDNT